MSTAGPGERFESDALGLADEPPLMPGAEPLLRTVMVGGQLLAPHPPLAAARERRAGQIEALPDAVKRLHAPASYPVRPSRRLVDLTRSLEAMLEGAEAGATDGERREKAGG
jgi:hypothetical protein